MPSLSMSFSGIEMDSVLRANCGVKLGDSVRFEKLHATVSIVDATAVFLKSTTPLEQSEYLVNAFLQQVLGSVFL
jgi:hypothetical protein